MKRNSLILIKAIYEKPLVNIVNGKILNVFLPRLGKCQVLLFSILFNIVLELLVITVKGKERKSLKIGKEEEKLYLHLA